MRRISLGSRGSAPASWSLIRRACELKDAIRIARSVVREGQAEEPVSIEHRGKVVRHFVLMPDGKVEEEAIGL